MDKEAIRRRSSRPFPEEQRVLETASITGTSFTANVNILGTGVDQEKFEDVCEDLSRRQHMVRRTGSHQSPDGTISQCYEFAHELYREVFYRRQAPERLARLRLRIGATFFPLSMKTK